MDVNDLLTETYGRLPDLVRGAVDGLTPEQLRWAPAPGANPVGWLVWHLTRVQDHHVAELLEADQIWVGDGWAQRFAREPDPDDTGYGHSAGQVAGFAAESAGALVDYFDAVYARTREHLAGVTPADLDRIVDRRWDPPVTLG